MLELIIKPQSSTNWIYESTSDAMQYVADGSSFSSHSNTTTLGSSIISTNDIFDIVYVTDAPNGNWQSFAQSGFGSASTPVLSGQSRNNNGTTGVPFSGIRMCSPSINLLRGRSGIYQEIYGLTTGKKYVVTVSYVVPTTAPSDTLLEVYVHDLTPSIRYEVATDSNLDFVDGSFSMEFEANNPTQVLSILHSSSVNECLDITGVSITEHVSELNYTYSDFADGSVSLDLFDNDIPLTLSISSFTDATSNLQSYSKDFTLPSTKRNDRAFTYIYDLSTTIEDDVNSFNPYIKTLATLKDDGQEIFSGELTLSSINKNDTGIVYEVNLQSRVSGLAEVLAERKLEDILLTELNHDYTAANIINSWTGDLDLLTPLASDSLAIDNLSLSKTGVLKYPFVNWVGDLIDNGIGNLTLTKLEEGFRPFIQCHYLFNKILKSAGFTYSSAFLDSYKFKKLFMDFNHGKDAGASISNISDGGGNFRSDWEHSNSTRWITPSYTKIKFDSIVSDTEFNGLLGSALWNTTDSYLQPITDGTTINLVARIPLFNETNTEKGVYCRTRHEKADGTITTIHSDQFDISGSALFDPSEKYEPNITNLTLEIGDKVYFEAKTRTSDTEKVRQQITADVNAYNTYVKSDGISSQTVELLSLLKDSRGDIGQWDFIKGFINMFNLVISPDPESPTNLIIAPYNEVFGLEAAKYCILTKDFEGRVEGFEMRTNHSGTSHSYNALGEFVGASDGAQTKNWHGANTVVDDGGKFIDGEFYEIEYKIKNITNGGSVNCVINKGYKVLDITHTSDEIVRSSFVFNKASNGGDDNLKIRFSTLDGVASTGLAYEYTIEYVRIIGTRANDIVTKDWTNKVDADSFSINIMDLKRDVNFNFEKDSDDSCHNKYTEAIPLFSNEEYNYGDLKYRASNYTALKGTDKVSVSPFASTIIKPLSNSAPLNALVLPSVYKHNDDNTFETFKNKPRILFDNGVKEFNGTFSSPSQNNSAGFNLQQQYLLFSHFSEYTNSGGVPSTALDYNFDNCQAVGIDNPSLNGLFNEYWSTYYDELYHVDTRLYKVKIKLNVSDISNFLFTDRIKIEGNLFRVNNIEYRSGGISNVELIKI